MKSLILAALAAGLTFLASCNLDVNANNAYATVRKAYPNAKIYRQPGSDGLYWIVIDSGAAYRVVTGNMNDNNISRKEPMPELR